ncbi:similar to Saccharomyces cerevisiae YOR009W TIR4 Cell wall mannoprotein of the Srp1p/Tip1p family of serine-alanine-rich proteins [Maudiozyma saulgeensis]|uniref:Similar to Saccharomyces cerevisiae YOR009W TIR4 Cell wall mannoprotein of the Srp1p/Tip1p family of serine-alanine-rich proteins n=1 Tax=Maudiozyma saulgeensis TaxID=1789683 RepID=A0A1X7RBB2_9SACH|nr:similar to Saccharomyces cerevisiae YOR009W TIR4 Cell wall mannoprotein of the Srp1p/Tip1p family of serine-alanine-rich proteins [Kazachstania saulgeensis]
MNFKLSALTALIAASVATAATTTITPYELAEIEGIMEDAKAHLFSYMLLVSSGKITLAELPAGVVDVAMAVINGDEGYTSLFTEVDFAGVSSMVTELPWYSTRLLPEINSIYSKELASSTLL